MIQSEKGTLLANLGVCLIPFNYDLASNLTSILLAHNWIFLASHSLNSNSVGTNYTMSSYYLQFEPDTSKLLTAVLRAFYFCMGEIFFENEKKHSWFGVEVLLLHRNWSQCPLSFLLIFELILIIIIHISSLPEKSFSCSPSHPKC